MAIELPPDLPRRLEDAVYVSVGLGVLAVQRAQVRRRELERLLARLRQSTGEPTANLKDRADELVPDLGNHLAQ
ncbi:MAG: hypothetical protein H0X58_01390 [Acidimicrobiia bacterium]|nr:hypothetical protein [Acidimicrobiia bacterium]